MPRWRATRRFERVLARFGLVRVAGVDEAGRGSLAGPVVAAAVVLPADCRLRGLRDSKQLAPAVRERLFAEVVAACETWAVAAVEPAEIDRINIAQASLKAMRDAVLALRPLPEAVLVDAFPLPDLWIPQCALVHGDARSRAIAAASIVAKVTRDRLMLALHAEDPRYGFDRHKGYATAEHLAALARFGYSPAHRRSFRPPSLFDRME